MSNLNFASLNKTWGKLGEDMNPGSPTNNPISTAKLPLDQSYTSNAPLQGKFPGGKAAQGTGAFDSKANDRSLIKKY